MVSFIPTRGGCVMQNIDKNSNSTNIVRLFFSNIGAAIIAVMISGIYVITDGIFVGSYVGKEALAAIGIAYPVFMILPGVGLMLGIGGGAMMSMNRGANELNLSKLAFVTSIKLILWLGAVCMLVLYSLSSALLSLQGAQLAIVEIAQQYLDIYTLGAVFAVASSAITLLIRNDEHPAIAMLIMVFGALLNIALNYYFLAVLSIGISGAAIATVISMVVVCLLSVGYFLSSKSKLIKFTLNLADFKSENVFKCLSINRQMTKGILVTGSSVMAMYIYSGFVIALHNKLFAQYGNTASLSAFAIVGYLMGIYYMLAEGIGDGVQPLLSFFYGQKRVDIIYKLMKISLVIVFTTGIATYLILNIWPEFFVMLFNGDTQVMNKAITGIKYHLAGMYLDGLIVLMTVYFMAVQRLSLIHI